MVELLGVMTVLFGCTKEMVRKLDITIDTRKIATDAFYCWHVKLFVVYGDWELLLMNDLTRFPMFMQHIHKEDVDHLEERFAQLFHDLVCYMDLPGSLADAYLKNQKYEYGKAYDFSIMSQMHSLSRLYQYHIVHNIHNFYDDIDATMEYARIPCFKYNLYPMQLLKEELLKRYGVEESV